MIFPVPGAGAEFKAVDERGEPVDDVEWSLSRRELGALVNLPWLHFLINLGVLALMAALVGIAGLDGRKTEAVEVISP